MMARAVGVEPEIVNVPLDIARTLRPPLIHWGEGLVGGMVFSIDKALDHLDWEPQYGVEDGYRHSYEWFVEGGRDHYEFDFSADHAVLEQLRRAV
jgi:nucleoside-diphosphate-sugar epimerase